MSIQLFISRITLESILLFFGSILIIQIIIAVTFSSSFLQFITYTSATKISIKMKERGRKERRERGNNLDIPCKQIHHVKKKKEWVYEENQNGYIRTRKIRLQNNEQ